MAQVACSGVWLSGVVGERREVGAAWGGRSVALGAAASLPQKKRGAKVSGFPVLMNHERLIPYKSIGRKIKVNDLKEACGNVNE